MALRYIPSNVSFREVSVPFEEREARLLGCLPRCLACAIARMQHIEQRFHAPQVPISSESELCIGGVGALYKFWC